ncbi:glycosyltransferase family 2 protein [Gymnodinialimonas sp. 2305UL16-5]|uniref:glycosyltransferase family 2 protein n=1 Tax=Gymnodinialimonas mytili TaxID=3126503 RepID=UPI0030967767
MGIAKNEGMNIDEWIDHYLWQGADRIVLIDNGSTDDTVARAERWAADGHPVTIMHRSQRSMQVPHYKSVFRELALQKTYRWLLIVDLDEFLFCPNGDRVADALTEFGSTRLIYFNWRHFGAAGQDDHPDSLRRRLTHRRPSLGSHRDTKWIARTSALNGGRNIGLHKVPGVSSRHVVSDNARFQLNHYITQSREFFFKVKATRGSAFSKQNDHVRTAEYFDKANAGCTYEDRTLVDLLEGHGPKGEDRTNLAAPTEI